MPPALACSHLAQQLPFCGEEERGRWFRDAGGCCNAPARGRTLPGESRGGRRPAEKPWGCRDPLGMSREPGGSLLSFHTPGLVPTVPA